MSDEISEPIAGLVAAYVEGTLGDAARQRLVAWVRADPANEAAFIDQVRLHLALTGLLRPDLSESALRRARLIPGSFASARVRRVVDSTLSVTGQRARRRRPAPLRWLAAASILVLVGAGAGALLLDARRDAGAPSTAVLATATLETRIERGGKALVLAEGGELRQGDVLVTGEHGPAALSFSGESTRIDTEANTRLTVLAGPGKRLRLDSGAVHVQAAPQPAGRPLVISTPRTDVTVVGTAFDVVASPVATWLDVRSGTVQLGRAGDGTPFAVTAGQRALAGDVLSVVPADHGSGLLGAYYSGSSFETLVLERIDPRIDFDWADRGPAAGVEVAHFSVRWTGELAAPADGTYKFYVPSDDGVRMWLDGELVYDNWRIQSITRGEGRHATHALKAGHRSTIRLDYFEYEHLAAVQLEWEGPGLPRQVIDTAFLYPLPR